MNENITNFEDIAGNTLLNLGKSMERASQAAINLMNEESTTNKALLTEIKEKIEETNPKKMINELECTLSEDRLKKIKTEAELVEKLTDLKEDQKIMNQNLIVRSKESENTLFRLGFLMENVKQETIDHINVRSDENKTVLTEIEEKIGETDPVIEKLKQLISEEKTGKMKVETELMEKLTEQKESQKTINQTLIVESKKSRRVIKVQGNADMLLEKLNIPLEKLKSVIMDKMENLLKLENFKDIQNNICNNLDMLNTEVKDLKISIQERENHKKLENDLDSIKSLIHEKGMENRRLNEEESLKLLAAICWWSNNNQQMLHLNNINISEVKKNGKGKYWTIESHS
jgi:hypothetical protein